MKLCTFFSAIIAAAAAGQVYTHQSEPESYTSADIYQSALELQQQGLYSDQSHAHTGAASRPSGERTARILSLVSESDGHEYAYSYETENGIKAQEMGQISDHESGTQAHGAYSYTGDDGHTYTVTYTADEHGFHPQGAHLPTPPPIPEAIVKSLEQNAKDEAAGVYDDGKYEEPESHHQEPQQQHELSYHQQQIHQHELSQQQQQLNHHQQQMHPHELSQQQQQLSHHQQQMHQHELSQQHQQQLRQQQMHQQAAHAFQYETSAFLNDGAYQHGGGYHTLNIPVEGYRKH